MANLEQKLGDAGGVATEFSLDRKSEDVQLCLGIFSKLYFYFVLFF